MCFIDNIFYLWIYFKIINKYNTTFIRFLLIHYIFKRWENIIYIQCVCVCGYNHVDFKYVYLQIILWKQKINKSSRYDCCSNVGSSEDSNAFSINLLDIFVNCFYICVDLGKIFKNEIYLLSFRQSLEKIIMVKVRYLCMWQKMMWNNVVNLSHIFC
jgi:hypothetical protein